MIFAFRYAGSVVSVFVAENFYHTVESWVLPTNAGTVYGLVVKVCHPSADGDGILLLRVRGSTADASEEKKEMFHSGMFLNRQLLAGDLIVFFVRH